MACNGCKSDDNNDPDVVPCGEVECASAATCVDEACVCKPGFEGDGQTCTEIRLACDDDDACGAAGTCTEGYCVCDAGYTVTTTGCADADECAAGIDDCDPAATCTNTDGGFSCACPGSAPGDGRTCEPFDECSAGAHDCDGEHVVCVDLDAGFECGCDTGYTRTRDSCSLLVDCNANPDACDANASCTDTPDGAACVCDAGFAGDGATCRQTGFTTLSSVDGHICGLRPDGKIACWGARRLGADATEQIYGTSRPAPEPTGSTWTTVDVQTADMCATRDDGTIWCGPYGTMLNRVGTESDWIDVRTSNVGTQAHYCALKSGGQLWCWGTNAHAQLGLGNVETVDAPTQVGTATWSNFEIGHARTCGVQPNGTLWCWGGAGLLGPEVWSDVPRQVGQQSDWARVQMSGFDNYALKVDGTVHYWRGHVATPASLGPQTWTSFGHTDYVDCGVKSDGTLWCKGANQFGLLGIEGVSVASDFIQVGRDADWGSLHMGSAVGCAIKTSGDTYCWGRNQWGEIGVGTLPYRFEPTTIAPGVGHKAVAIAQDHSCAVRSTGELSCTGGNLLGAVGLPRMDVFALRTHQVVDPGPWDEVAVGTQHTCLIGEGRLSCFGAASLGQTGLGPNAVPSHVPTPVDAATDWVDVVANASSTCGRKSDGSLYCWGYNQRGQLGVGDTDSRDVPTRVGTETWSQVFMGGLGEHVCATRAADDSLWCWGSNDEGALGTGDTTSSMVPVPVDGSAWRSVSIGHQSTLGVKADGTLWQWGSLTALTANAETLLSPSRVGTDSNWAMVASSQQHACATRDDGALYCWGQQYGGATGQPGQPVNALLVPTRVGTSANWARVFATQTGTCGLQTGGALLCWGRDYGGNLGFGSAWYPTPQRVRD